MAEGSADVEVPGAAPEAPAVEDGAALPTDGAGNPPPEDKVSPQSTGGDGQGPSVSPDAVPEIQWSKHALEAAEIWQSFDPVPDCAVVWLHGLGETDVYWKEYFAELEMWKIEELKHFRWIMPRALLGPCTAREGAMTFQWFDTPEYPVCLIIPGVPDHKRTEEDPDEIRSAVDVAHEAVAALEAEGVPSNRIIIAGFGQGGTLALHSALRYPRRLAGCAMLSGYVPCKAELMRDATPKGLESEVLWLHGLNDSVLQPDCAASMAEDLTRSGVHLDFRLTFDMAHETNAEELFSFKTWLIERLAPQPPPPEDAEEGMEDGEAAQVEAGADG